MDSRLRGNDNSRWQGKETLFQQPLKCQFGVPADLSNPDGFSESVIRALVGY
jgi:hypothetical protein